MEIAFCELCKKETMHFKFERERKHYFRCKYCGLEKIYPQPDDSELNRIYGNRYYEAWGRWDTDVVRNAKRETFLARFRLVPKIRNKKVLDCGCAAGYLLEVAEELGFIPYGIEINPKAVDMAKKRFPGQQIYQSTMEETVFPKDFFYAVFMNDFLEHTRDPITVLKKTYTLIEEGGYLVITTPDTNSLSHHLMNKSWLHYKTEHLFYFNRRNIRLMLAKAGFKTLSTSRAWKCLNLDYIKSIFAKYPRNVLTFLFKRLDFLPQTARFKKMWFAFGEMVILAQK